jgi:hypothetical protein
MEGKELLESKDHCVNRSSHESQHVFMLIMVPS